MGSQLLSLATIFGQILIGAYLIWFLLAKLQGKGNPLTMLSSTWLMFLSFLVALLSTAGSLFYSDILGYEPCKLCWFQRIFMYPLVVLFGVALWKREYVISRYALAMTTIGGLIAAYHYLLQREVAPATSCSAVGASVSCSQVFVMNYGYITIPLMALTAFVMIFILQWALMKKTTE